VRRLTVGRVSGHRGRAGELTVRVTGGDGEAWRGLRSVWVRRAEQTGTRYEVEQSRGYRDRLVLKLRGVDDANTAAGLRGCEVLVEEAEAPALADGEFYAGTLLGMDVMLEDGTRIGEVLDVAATGGADLLVVRVSSDRDAGETRAEPILIPMAGEIVRSIDAERRRIVIRPPEGLLELNREGES